MQVATIYGELLQYVKLLGLQSRCHVIDYYEGTRFYLVTLWGYFIIVIDSLVVVHQVIQWFGIGKTAFLIDEVEPRTSAREQKDTLYITVSYHLFSYVFYHIALTAPPFAEYDIKRAVRYIFYIEMLDIVHIVIICICDI